MFNTFKTIKNHNGKITKAHGEEFLHIELSEREKGLVTTLDLPLEHMPSIKNVGDYLLTMLTNENSGQSNRSVWALFSLINVAPEKLKIFRVKSGLR